MMLYYEGPLRSALTAIIIFSAAYIAYLYALNRTGLATRLKRKGYYRCPHYQHKSIISGSDWQTDAMTASANGLTKDWYFKLFAKYGRTFETRIWGRRIFQTCDAVNVQSLLTAPTTDIGVGPSRIPLLSWLGPGTFTVDGEVWKNSRDMLKPVFKKTAVSDMGRLDKHLGRLMNEMKQEDFEVDVQDLFIRMFLDFSMDLIIGEDVNTVSNDFSKVDAHSFISACDGSQLQVIRSMQPWLVRWWKGWTKTWDHPVDATRAFIDQYVDSAVQDFQTAKGGPIPRSPAFLDELIREAGCEDKIYLRDQILNVFMPGRDSAAIMTSYIMYYLARHPTAYAKVRAEVLEAGFGRQKMTYDAIKNLKYTNAVVQESLRLAGPPNGQTARDVLSDIVLPRGGGMNGDQPILIPKGSMVCVQIHAIHRDEETWGPDPHAFRPERWLEMSKTSQRLAFEYMPFGGGRRICPALALAMGELAYILATFAVRFRELQNRDQDQPLLEEGAIVRKIRNGVHIKLVE